MPSASTDSAAVAAVPCCESETGELREALVAAPDPAALAAAGHDPERHGFRAAGVPRMAIGEWHAFASALAAAGVRLRDLRQRTEEGTLPNLHYTRDIAITIGERVLLAAPSPGRRDELAVVGGALAGLGVEAFPLRGRIEFGDVFVAGPDLVVVGLGPRTDCAGVQSLREEAAAARRRFLVVDFRHLARDVSLAHLDLGFNLVGDAALLHEPLAAAPAIVLSEEGRLEGTFASLLEDAGFEPLPLPGATQLPGGANLLSLGPRRVLAYAEALEAGLDALLARAGVEAVAVPGKHLIQSGGGPRCLSLPLVRA